MDNARNLIYQLRSKERIQLDEYRSRNAPLLERSRGGSGMRFYKHLTPNGLKNRFFDAR